jgi:halimadienyl-diphosphate synthase
MTYIKKAKALVNGLNDRMGPSPYDIAWMARVRHPNNEGPRWPDLLEWLVNHQHPDGSWGGSITYYHDRIICTLAAAIALKENRDLLESADVSIQRAERYLWHHIHLLPRDPFELVGFELVFPTLLEEARKLSLNVPTHACGYGKIQTEKLRLIPPDMLYSPKITTVHSLEFLGESGDPEKMSKALARNGSLGNSPSATAYYLTFRPDDTRAVGYLESLRSHMEHIIYLYPFSTFELAWVLNNLSFSGFPVKELASDAIWESMASGMEPRGVGLDETFGIPDADTTAVSLYLLTEAGYNVDPRILLQFEDPERHIFRTYHYERNPSVSTNIHALEALRLMPDYPNRQRVRKQVIAMLLDNRSYNVYWTDKWHASPYYVTAHTLLALLRAGNYLAKACQYTIEWLIYTQHEDGSWGFFQVGTAEETAYALTVLLHCYQRQIPVDVDSLHRGAAYLKEIYDTADDYPELWLGKDLYSPKDVVSSAILSALMLYENTF